MRRISLYIACVIAKSLVSVSAGAAPIIANGSFEQVQIGSPFYSLNPANVPGWTHGGIVGDALLWAIGYSDGGGTVTTAGAENQFVTLGGGFDARGTADWSTTITGLTPGVSYVLSFMTATEVGTGIEPGGPQSMTVGFLSGSNTASQTFTSPDSTAAYWRTWMTQNYTFSPSAVSAVVDFSVVNQQYDMGLDDVTIGTAATGVPGPSSYFWPGLALAGVALLRRQKARVSGQHDAAK